MDLLHLRVAAETGYGSDTSAVLSPNLKSACLNAVDCCGAKNGVGDPLWQNKTVFYNDIDVEAVFNPPCQISSSLLVM